MVTSPTKGADLRLKGLFFLQAKNADRRQRWWKMAIKICTLKEVKLGPKDPSCPKADQCCWYETATDQSSACHNRHALVCQTRRDELFGGKQDPEEILASY
jgi:hypothetical protein